MGNQSTSNCFKDYGMWQCTCYCYQLASGTQIWCNSWQYFQCLFCQHVPLPVSTRLLTVLKSISHFKGNKFKGGFHFLFYYSVLFLIKLEGTYRKTFVLQWLHWSQVLALCYLLAKTPLKTWCSKIYFTLQRDKEFQLHYWQHITSWQFCWGLFVQPLLLMACDSAQLPNTTGNALCIMIEQLLLQVFVWKHTEVKGE